MIGIERKKFKKEREIQKKERKNFDVLAFREMQTR